MDADFPETMLANIERFFTTESRRQRGQDVYPAVFANEGFFPLQRKRELAKMLSTAREAKPRIVMEIGADKGGGFYHWVKSLSTVERAIAVEIRGTPYAAAFQKAFPAQDLLFLGGPSRAPETLAAVRTFLGDSRLDVLFIDGDKSHFFTDFEAYYPLMRKQTGIIFMHDITDPAPGAAFAKAVADPRVQRHTTIIDTSEVAPALAREAAGTPATDSYEGWLRQWRGASCGVGVLYV